MATAVSCICPRGYLHALVREAGGKATQAMHKQPQEDEGRLSGPSPIYGGDTDSRVVMAARCGDCCFTSIFSFGFPQPPSLLDKLFLREPTPRELRAATGSSRTVSVHAV